MNKHRSSWIAALCGVIWLTCSINDARAERRIALVVGNANYNNPSLVLSNPKNDAEDVAAALRAVGFEVVQAVDTNKRDLDVSMAKFARLATDADAALFYYAGHALQYQGRNYLMPIDAEVEDEVSLRYQMMAIDDVRAALDRTSGVKVMILDACRNNPVVESLRRRASGETRNIGGGVRGLARIDKTQGMVIAYSTAADEVAADGKGRNSPFTGAFLKRLKEPGLEIEQLFRRVAADVNSETGGRQRPETYVSLLSDYYLNQSDRVAFDTVKDAADPATLQDFIKKFPSSSYVPDARYRIQRIELSAQEKQLQEARQQQAARLLEEQLKAEREAALRQQEEQRAKLAAAERQRTEHEAAQRLQDEQQRAKIARAEPPSANQDTRPVRRNEDQVKIAGVERQDLKGQDLKGQDLSNQDLKNQAPQNSTSIAKVPEIKPQPAAPAPQASSGQSCDQDNARLARLRSNPSRDEIIQFEQELSCDRLRPQLVRLRESLVAANSPPPAAAISEPPKPPTVERTAPPPPTLPIAVQSNDTAAKPEAALKPPERLADLKSQPSPPVTGVDQVQACKQDEARLTRLRAKPNFADVTALERELGCEKLRPQIVRLRESLTPLASAPGPASDRQADIKPPLPPTPSISQDQSCEQDRARLARLRGSASRDEVARFERELSCEQLRPQVLRLRESLSGR
jgi:uncharacterized caspase-like protein